MQNITNDASIPPHKHGPKGNASRRPALLNSTRYNPQIPPAKIPSTAASTVPFQPRNRPPAAISLISPPPKPPGTSTAVRNMGTLITSIPSMRSTISGPGTVKTEQIPVTKTAPFSRLGIRMVLKSVQAMTPSSQKMRQWSSSITFCYFLSPFSYRLQFNITQNIFGRYLRRRLSASIHSIIFPFFPFAKKENGR